jgi:hypothetical protein
MGRASSILLLAFLGGAVVVACDRTPFEPPNAAQTTPTTWLRGDTEQRFHLVEKHLRGFDLAMVETGYRYSELYWAGRDHNWAYAGYQLDKIETALANGVERRPKRGASAKMMDGPLATVRAAVAARDPEEFDSAFLVITRACNACHRAEAVEFVHVAPPVLRGAPVQPPPVESGETR